ncbi:MAG: glycosyltransferase, partial [Rhodothermales bacterium]
KHKLQMFRLRKRILGRSYFWFFCNYTSSMKRLLVIAYYFPPMGLSGVQRITKFVKYLPENNWSPTVLTVEPGGYFAFDSSLMEDLTNESISIERTSAFDPTRIFNKKTTVSLPKESSRKWLSKLSQFVFIPDNKIGWYKQAIDRAVSLHKENPFDCILATAPPYTSCLIARQISKRCGIPYMLDFRDDWLGNPRHQYPTILHKQLHKRLESKAFKDAASIITINDVIADAMKRRHPARADAISIVNQGFDPADFTNLKQPPAKGALNLLYNGVFYDAQKPDYFLKALAAFIAQHPEEHNSVQATFTGLLPDNSQALIEELGLGNVVSYKGYVSHQQAVEELCKTDVPWMTVGSGPGQASISTSKLFEYIGTRKPILGLVPEGAARATLENYGASFLAYPEDVDGIQRRLNEIFSLWKKDQLPFPSDETVAAYDRKVLAATLASMLNECITQCED